jgi:hypothetical protein
MEDSMADTKTLTDTTVPTPTEVAEAPKTEAEEASAKETTPSDETDAEVRTEETKTDEEAPPWAATRDPYDVLELEELKPHLERRDRRNEERVRADYQKQYEEATGSWKATEAHAQLASIYGNILQKLEDGDSDTVGKLVGRLEQAVEPYSESYKKGLQAEGSQETAKELYGAVMGSLDPRGQDELQDYLSTARNANWGDVLKKRDEIREGRSKKTTSDTITSLESQLEALKAKVRPDGPDTVPKGGGGGKKYSELTSEERRAMSSGEIDAMQARERGE